MEIWRDVLLDWVNAVSCNETSLNCQQMQDETLFFLLMKSLAMQKLDDVTKRRLVIFIQRHHSKCVPGELFDDSINGIYLTSLLLVNSSLSEGLRRYLSSKLDDETKNGIDMYLTLILSIRDRICKEIIDIVIVNSKEAIMKNVQANPIDLSHHINTNDKLKLDDYSRIDNENNLLKDKLTNCQLEKSYITEHAIKLQNQLEQSLNEIELLKGKCEIIEEKYNNISNSVTTYETSIESLNLIAKQLVIERNTLNQRVNELQHELQINNNNNITNDIPMKAIDNNININRNNKINIENNHLNNDNGVQQMPQVRLERLDPKIINAVSQRNNNKNYNNINMSGHVAPMKAKRQRKRGRECWKIIP